MQNILAKTNRISRLFQFSERKVQDYFKMARVAPGTYDLLQCIEIYVNDNTVTDESQALKQVDRELKQHRLKILQKEYHHKDDIERIVLDMLYRFKSKLTSVPSLVSNLLLNKDNKREIEEILKNEINNALNELTEYEFKEDEDDELDE